MRRLPVQALISHDRRELFLSNQEFHDAVCALADGIPRTIEALAVQAEANAASAASAALKS